MKVETLPVIKGENNLPNYDEQDTRILTGKRLIKTLLGMKQAE